MSLTESGPAGTPTFPGHPDPAPCGRLLRRARVTGRCPARVAPGGPGPALDRPEELVGAAARHLWWDR